MNEKEKTSTGFPPKLMTVLSWLFLIAAVIVLATEKENRAVRVQVWQAVIFKGISYLLMPIFLTMLFVGFPIVGLTSEATGSVFPSVAMLCCFLPLFFIFAMVYQIFPWIAIIMLLADKEVKIPLVYKWAEKLADRWA